VGELHNALRGVGINVTREQASELLRSVDKDSSGTLDINEFVALIVNGGRPPAAGTPQIPADVLARARQVFSRTSLAGRHRSTCRRSCRIEIDWAALS
jgi:hypothetical protein